MGKNKEHIVKLNENIKTAETRAKYSIERYDILIISLSSGAIKRDSVIPIEWKLS